MHPFTYARPSTIAEAVSLLQTHGPDARLLAGGTDLIIRLRDGTVRPRVVIDLKRIAEMAPAIREADGRLVISATAVMTDIVADPLVRQRFTALAEAAAVVGSVQIRNRATLAGNLCNASPAADTAPSLLVYGAEVVAAGPAGTRRIALDDFFVRSGVTTLSSGELVTAIELPIPGGPLGAAHVRRTRRRGHDLASVTLSCSVDAAGMTRLAYGSVGPRPVLMVDESGILADPGADPVERGRVFDRMFAAASPSARSMRASPEYRLAMLRVLGERAVGLAVGRLASQRSGGNHA
jgi:CO/xanthine dehydrogenase FAD-binding subunit